MEDSASTQGLKSNGPRAAEAWDAEGGPPSSFCSPGSVGVSCSASVLLRCVLLDTDGAPGMLTAIQVFTRCFVDALERENKQVCYTARLSFPPEKKAVEDI